MFKPVIDKNFFHFEPNNLPLQFKMISTKTAPGAFPADNMYDVYNS